ncbi:MAG: SRPBCC family protein [Propionibacteriaceae bacterium]|jgi:hypothetical protein|nr:SRPBCC family protein [Propionibacteriaceae bacterium]
MIRLKDSVDIAVPLDRLYQWLQSLDVNFVKWSPHHEYFQKTTGGLDVGDEIQFKELVMGVPYDIRGVIREHEKSDAGFRIMFASMSGWGHIYFIGEATEGGCRFTHIEEFGKPDTPWGRFINWLLFKVLFKKRANWQLIKDDMAEDNIYLKQILETGVYPERKA